MKTVTNIIHFVLAAVVLAIAAPTANSAPGDLIVPSSHGNIYQLPINPFGTASFVWDNSNKPAHVWAGLAFDPSGNIYVSENGGCHYSDRDGNCNGDRYSNGNGIGGPARYETASTGVACGAGSTHLPCSRIKSLRRSTASTSGMLNFTAVLPT